ncbi:MAG: hypothetical protein KDI27_08995 [Gammaproteobacteria bacterium]|nr:hypothetical protein [Gammaproteobacteria bacterium]MCP5417464.1 hypothetical protein [Chromatiaceae bacterium]
MGIGGNDAATAKESVESVNGDNGVPWVGGQAGGAGQPVLQFTGKSQGWLQHQPESSSHCSRSCTTGGIDPVVLDLVDPYGCAQLGGGCRRREHHSSAASKIITLKEY